MLIHNALNNSSPLVLHINGEGSQENMLNLNKFKGFNKNFTDLIVDSYEIVCPLDLTIITFATEQIVDNCPLIKQLNAHNVPFVNLCSFYEDKWYEWNNLKKIEYLKNYLNGGNVKTKYVIVLDAIDILLAQDFSNIVNRFENHNVDVLYSATRSNFPRNGEFGYSFEIEKETSSHFKFLNAGCVIAKVDALSTFVTRCYDDIDLILNPIKSEQFEIRKSFNKNYVELNMGYDVDTNIFLTVGSFLRPGTSLAYDLKEVDSYLIFEIFRKVKV